MNKNFFFLILLFFSGYSNASDTKLTLLKPTGQEIDNLVEMEVIDDTSQIAVRIKEIVEKTVIGDFLDIYRILQVYLFNTTGKSIEPAYLALTQNQGGYARKGFVLNEGGLQIRKENSFYVDINVKSAERDYNTLMSITQLYPHELSHIMYRLLSSSDSIEEYSRNVNVHFFSIITDYQIAFNEGFAEHLENIARLFERNQEVIDGINADTTRIVVMSQRAINGFTKDFKNPLRFGFYKMTMLAWYQPFEDYKRFAYALNGFAKYANKPINTYNRQNNLIFRNTGVAINPEKLRNKVQLMATEGTISSFFSMLLHTDLKDRYRKATFYHPFLSDTLSFGNIEEQFTPLQNLFIKYFFILDKYVILEKSNKTQLIDFIDGYINEFPEEADIILNTFRKATGMDYDNTIPPPIWLLLKNQPHGVLALDAYAGLTVPFYTFDLNMAEFEDLMIIKGLNEHDALAILNFREKYDLFTSLNQLSKIEGLSEEGKKLVLASEFDQEYFDELEFPEELNIKSVIMAPLQNLVIYTVVYFTILMVVYFAMIRREKLSILRALGLITGYLLLWILIVFSGLIYASVNNWHWSVVLVFPLLAMLISSLFKGVKKHRILILISLMTLIILVSII